MKNNNTQTVVPNLESMTLAEIGNVIHCDWKNVYFGAVPYLGAMRTMNNINEQFGADSGKSIVVYFLGNAQTWRGDVARAVKAELNKRVKAA